MEPASFFVWRAGLVAAALAVGPGAAATGAQAQDCGGGTCISTDDTFAESLVFNPATVTTTAITIYSTQILGRLNGGTPLYDQIFGVPYADPVAQAGVAAARAALTNTGGPGVIIAAPVLTASSSNTSSSSVTTYSLAETRLLEPTTVIIFGPEMTAIGQLSACDVAGLPGSTRPTCQNLPGTPYLIGDGATHFNTITNTQFTINQSTDTTNTTTLFEQYTLLSTTQAIATVQAFGIVHTAIQSGALDASSRFLRRMGYDTFATGESGPAFAMSAPGAFAGSASGIHMWAEGYGVWSETDASDAIPGDDRTQYGFATGLAGNLTPNFTLGLGIDHGNTDVSIDNGFENGDFDLTQVGVYGGYTSGPWFANLAGTFGGGDADTQTTSPA